MDLLLLLRSLLCVFCAHQSSSSADDVLIEVASPSRAFNLSLMSSLISPIELAFLNNKSTISVCALWYLSVSFSLLVNIKFGDKTMARLLRVIFDCCECAATFDTNWQMYWRIRRFVSGSKRQTKSIEVICSFGVFSWRHLRNVPCNNVVRIESGNSRKNCFRMLATSWGWVISDWHEPPFSICCWNIKD